MQRYQIVFGARTALVTIVTAIVRSAERKSVTKDGCHQVDHVGVTFAMKSLLPVRVLPQIKVMRVGVRIRSLEITVHLIAVNVKITFGPMGDVVVKQCRTTTCVKTALTSIMSAIVDAGAAERPYARSTRIQSVTATAVVRFGGGTVAFTTPTTDELRVRRRGNSVR